VLSSLAASGAKVSEIHAMNQLYPIVLFVYKRFAVTHRVIEALKENPEAPSSELIIFSDAPKTTFDSPKVEELRRFLRTIKGFRTIQLRFRDENLGLARSFISGISEILQVYEAAIILEDDNLVSKSFLSYMNESITYYKGNPRVSCVTGYSYPLIPKMRGAYFLRGAETWSIGVWRESWTGVEWDEKKLIQQLKELKSYSRFSFGGFGIPELLELQRNGSVDSWGVRWWASSYVRSLHCLYPPEPLCVSIGYGDDSVHCSGDWNPLYLRPNQLAHDYAFSPAPKSVKQRWTTTIRCLLMNLFTLPLYTRVQNRFAK